MTTSPVSSPASRPRRPQRTRRVWVRFSDDEYAALQAKAREAGVSVSALLRGHGGAVRLRDRETERQRNVTLNRLNANLNMIAKWVNTWRDTVDAYHVVSRLDAIQNEVLRLIEAWEGQRRDRGIF